MNTHFPIQVYSVPWDVTTTYRTGTHQAPQYIQEAMHQLDEYHPFSKGPLSCVFSPQNERIVYLQDEFKPLSMPIIHALNQGREIHGQQLNDIEKINVASRELNQIIYDDLVASIDRPLILCGGEHGVGLGYICLLYTSDAADE